MKKQAKDIKKSDRIKLAGRVFNVEEFEISDIGKQGKRKVRIVAKADNGEKITIIRPEDYPIEIV
ncbi:MAG: hypothetical protein AABX28_03255 [Nanoarchaeota archaeon]